MIPIFYAVDDHYAAQLSVALHALRQHASLPLQVYILTAGLTPGHRALIDALASPQLTIQYVSIGAQLKARMADHENTLRADYFTFTIYFRLFIAELFPTLDRALYLDADTLVMGDIAELWAQPLNGALVGAVPDPFIGTDPDMRRYAQNAIGVAPERYCNSGVLVMDLAAMRAAHFGAHFQALLDGYHFRSLAPDQDYLNAIAAQRLALLPADWNVQGAQPITAPKLVHYNLFAKPWHYAAVPHGDAFWAAARATPALAELQATLAAFGPADRAADRRHQAALGELARTIVTLPQTFASVAASGVQVAL